MAQIVNPSGEPSVSWRRRAWLLVDFENALAGTPLVEQSAGAGAAIAAAVGDQNRVGVVEASTGTTATGTSGALTAPALLRLGGGRVVTEMAIRFPTLSAVAEEYIARVGLLDTVVADAVDGAYFEYDRLTSGNVWRVKTSSNSVRTTTVSATAVAAATWYRLQVVVSPTASSVEFYVDGTLLATHTANIPTAAGRETGLGFWIGKSAGVTARTIQVDYALLQSVFTTSR